jgi:hypothetical protein
MSNFTVEVYYCKSDDVWQANLEKIGTEEVEWGDMPCYGRGKTIDAALAETGKQLQAYVERRRAEYLASQAEKEGNGRPDGVPT